MRGTQYAWLFTQHIQGHSMVLEPASKKLFIFAGQREDGFLSDMYAYDIATNTVTQVGVDRDSLGLPACFTQRAVLDPTLREIYVYEIRCALVH